MLAPSVLVVFGNDWPLSARVTDWGASCSLQRSAGRRTLRPQGVEQRVHSLPTRKDESSGTTGAVHM